MKSALLHLLHHRSTTALAMGLILAFWWVVFSAKRMEYPTGQIDEIPLHGRIVLTLLCSAITGLCAVEFLELLRTFFKP